MLKMVLTPIMAMTGSLKLGLFAFSSFRDLKAAWAPAMQLAISNLGALDRIVGLGFWH